MADVESKRRQESHPRPMPIPFWPGSIGGGALPCFNCNDRAATVVAVGAGQQGDHPQLSLVFVVQ